MAEIPDQESKTEEPTEKKIRDALDKGKIPVSREASIVASMAALMVVLAFVLADAVRELALTLKRLIDDPGGFPLANGADALNLLVAVASEAGRFVLPIVVILAGFGLAAPLLQNTPRVVVDRILPDLSRLSITQGWRRLFGAQGRMEFAKAVFKLVS